LAHSVGVCGLLIPSSTRNLLSDPSVLLEKKHAQPDNDSDSQQLAAAQEGR
jgi:hypothetical protein